MQYDDFCKKMDELKNFNAEEHAVLSLYLSLEPPADPVKTTKDLIKREKEYLLNLDLPPTFLKEADADFQNILSFISSPTNRQGGRGIVIFSCSPKGLWKVFPVPKVWRNSLVADSKVHLRQLVALRDEFGLVYVVAWDKRKAKLYKVYFEHVEEVADFFNPDLPRPSKFRTQEGKFVYGGKSSGLSAHGVGEYTFRNWVKEETTHHLRNLAETLYQMYRKEKFDALLIGAPKGEKHNLEDYLHSYLKDILLGVFPVDVRTLTESEVHELTKEFLRKKQEKKEKELLDEVEQLAGRGLATIGPQDTIKALMMGQVYTLIVASGKTIPGFRCPDSGALMVKESPCPEGRVPVPIRDIVDEAITWALDQGAKVEVVLREDLIPRVKILSSLLRYKIS